MIFNSNKVGVFHRLATASSDQGQAFFVE